MGKCLVTKLNSIVDNDSILKVGELRIKNNKLSNPTDSTQFMDIGFTVSTKLKIIGDGSFNETKTFEIGAEKTKTIGPGNLGFWLSNSDFEISIPNKYNLTLIRDQIHSYLIDDFKHSKNLTELSLNGSSVTGELSSLSGMSGLTSLSLGGQVTGELSSLSGMSGLTSLSLYKGTISGDLATLPPKVHFIKCKNGTKLTWTNRPTTSTIIGCETVAVDNVDEMLKNEAECIAYTGSVNWFKIISIKGTRTSASDAAVQTLQQKGYTVILIPA